MFGRPRRSLLSALPPAYGLGFCIVLLTWAIISLGWRIATMTPEDDWIDVLGGDRPRFRDLAAIAIAPLGIIAFASKARERRAQREAARHHLLGLRPRLR